MLLKQHVAAGSHTHTPTHTHTQNNNNNSNDQSMNRMIAQVIQYILCVLPMRKIWQLSGKFEQHLSLYFGAVKTKLYWFL